MEIDRDPPKSKRGPEDWFTGEVWMEEIASPPAPARIQALSVRFTPGARTAWHRHPFGQVLHVTEGEGRAQRKGGPVEVIRPGDRISFEPGEEHWHGAAPATGMTHLALQEADEDRVPTYWGEHVADDDYLAEPAGPA
ncbi:MAG: cupin domain-containing protein [Actinomycetota bacterium]|nr:cupin domain-containing protein [Actinomycetota bacterium]